MSETRKAFQAGKERSARMAEVMRTRQMCSGVLDQRYHECDSKGHQKPDEKENYCGYCYRHIDYTSPETDAILEGRKNIPSMQQPLDAPVLMEKRKRDIERQKAKDYFRGVNKVRAELQESGKLEIEVDKAQEQA
jgi:hypothetical protein